MTTNDIQRENLDCELCDSDDLRWTTHKQYRTLRCDSCDRIVAKFFQSQHD